MKGKDCCVCGQKIARLDVYIVRAQGKICSQCVLDRGIPVGGQVSRRMLRQGEERPARTAGNLLPAGT